MSQLTDGSGGVHFTVPGVAVPKQSFRAGRRHNYRDPRVTQWQSTMAGWARLAGRRRYPKSPGG